MSIAPPQLKPSFKFLLNAQRPIVDSKPKICSTATTSKSPSNLIEVGQFAAFTISCILVHAYAPAKLPALLALGPGKPGTAAALMLLMHPDETALSWIVSIVWLIPAVLNGGVLNGGVFNNDDMAPAIRFVSPVCAMLILCCPSAAPASVIAYALSLARGLLYFATKKKCDAVLFSPSIPLLLFAACAIVLLDNNKRIADAIAAKLKAPPLDEVIVEEDDSAAATPVKIQ